MWTSDQFTGRTQYQRDLGKMMEWFETQQMDFNGEKCQNGKKNIDHGYKVLGKPLRGAKEKDLWSDHQ